MFDRVALVDELAQGVDADAQMKIEIPGRDNFVDGGGFDSLRDHRLIGNEEEQARWDFVMKSCDEERGCLHVDAHAANAGQILLASVIVFPDAAIGGVDGAGPVIP